MSPALFLAFSALLVIASLLVILHKNPVTSALYLVVAFCSLAGLYILLQAEFLGMVQIIVYAGAIMVLFLFVIMYLNLGHDAESGTSHVVRKTIGWLVGGGAVVSAVALFGRTWAPGPMSTDVPPAVGNTQALGQVLYTRYLFPFEITSVVLLVAIVGAIVIARGRGPGIAPADNTPAPAVPSQSMLRPGDSLTPAAGSVRAEATTPSGGAA
jgi:NADH-quinone oxidoreductase subunit J